MSEPRPGFQRDVNAVVDAFKVGLAFEPPAISVAEYRASLRAVGLPLTEPDQLEAPHFEFPDPDPPVVYEDDVTPEGDDDGNDPTA